MEESKNEATNRAHVLFDRFVQATTCKGTLKAFQELCDHLELKPKDHRSFYHKLKSKLNYWKAKALWAKLDKRGSHKDYKKGKVCTNTKVGPGTRWRRRAHRVEVACEAGRGQPQPGEASGLRRVWVLCLCSFDRSSCSALTPWIDTGAWGSQLLRTTLKSNGMGAIDLAAALADSQAVRGRRPLSTEVARPCRGPVCLGGLALGRAASGLNV